MQSNMRTRASQGKTKNWPFFTGDLYSEGDLFLLIFADFLNIGFYLQYDLNLEVAFSPGLTVQCTCSLR